jgi:apolipoprotein N-acyltransferase
MQNEVAIPSQNPTGRAAGFLGSADGVRAGFTFGARVLLALLSAGILVLSFPNFELWPFAWIALVPLLVVVGQNPKPWSSFLLGWIFGSVFFYGSCYWLTYSMIHTGGIPPVIAYLLLAPGAMIMGLFPAAFALLLARAIRKWGRVALFTAPIFWPALEWLRLEATGQLWNAIGYSQAYHPRLIQSARWGGVYAVGFLIVLVNASVAFVLVERRRRRLVIPVAAILFTVAVVVTSSATSFVDNGARADVDVIAIQPNVPMDLVKSEAELQELNSRHFEMSKAALQQLPTAGTSRLVIWPESPMNFSFGADKPLRDRLATFAQANHTSLLLNSQEAAPNNGISNSAVLINEQGGLVAQYDKIRLLPFGEYVPLPQWMPGAGLIRGLVGDFTPGTVYRLMPVGKTRAGVFICIESAYPSIARSFTREGASVLINISNDGYLGPTAVMRQHLANAIFRAVENERPLLRVTNSGITALITPTGAVRDATQPFKTDVRTWTVTANNDETFYVKHGDFFAVGFAAISLLIFALSFGRRRSSLN